jgi:hypothetical protein
MQIVTRSEQGLFPAPKEISLACSCPDWADTCKHVAAALYGVGARLDDKPELLFLLRGVDPVELIGKASAAEAVRQVAPIVGTARMDEPELGPMSSASKSIPIPRPARTSSKNPRLLFTVRPRQRFLSERGANLSGANPLGVANSCRQPPEDASQRRRKLDGVRCERGSKRRENSLRPNVSP